MFDGVAKHYDRTNSLTSLGFDRYWRSVTARELALSPGEKVLDIAAGTAVSTVALAMVPRPATAGIGRSAGI